LWLEEKEKKKESGRISDRLGLYLRELFPMEGRGNWEDVLPDPAMECRNTKKGKKKGRKKRGSSSLSCHEFLKRCVPDREGKKEKERREMTSLMSRPGRIVE